MSKSKNVKEGCGECKEEVKESNSMGEIRERRERVEQVMELLEDVHYKTESEKDDAILSFTKANLTIDEIVKLVRPLRADYLSNNEREVGVF